MYPIEFKESNRTLTKPEGMTDEECKELPVHNDGKESISCWKGTLLDRVRFLVTGKMWLIVLSGRTQPPVALRTDYPFIKGS